MEACEQLSIIHRDIKVENIFVSEFGDYKLGDFGIARVAEKTTGASTKIGTNSYMAPEIMRGENYDQRVDIYSLGLVLYRLLNKNRLPFLPPAPEPISFSQREEANAKRFRGDDFPVPSEADDSLCEIIFKATAFNPDDRYQSAKEFKKALEKYVGIQNVEDETIDPVPPIVSPVNPPQKEAVVSVASDDDDDDTIIAVPKPIDNDEKKDEIDNGRKKKIIFSLVAVIILLITIICGVVFKIYFEKNKNKEEYLTENTTTNSIMTEKVNETETDDQNDFVKETDNNAETEIVEEKEDENDNVYIYEDYGLKVTLPDGWSLDETKDIDEDIRIEISDNEQEPNWINIYKMNAIGLREDRRTLYAASQQSKYEVTRVEVIDFLGRDVESFYLEDSDDGNGAIRILNMDYGDYYIGIRFFSPMCEKDKIDEMMQFISAYPEKELPKEYAGMNVRFPDGWTKVDNPDDSTFEVYVVPTEEYNALSEGQISAPTTFFGVRSDTDGTADWTDKIWYQNTWGEWEIGSMLFMGKDRFYTEYITEGQQICRYIFISIPEKYNKLYYAVVIQASSKDEIEEIAGYFTAK